jgi:hypothetical protein
VQHQHAVRPHHSYLRQGRFGTSSRSTRCCSLLVVWSRALRSTRLKVTGIVRPPTWLSLHSRISALFLAKVSRGDVIVLAAHRLELPPAQHSGLDFGWGRMSTRSKGSPEFVNAEQA